MIVHRELTLEDYLSILRRRIWIIVVPAAVFAIGAYTISLFLASRYTSETVVLVEEQAVPESLVKPVIGGDVNQRLATMQEQILSRTRLQQIIEKVGLYKEQASRISMEDMVARLRKSITVSPVRPMAETRASGLPGFTVSVVAGQAYVAQQICTEITSFFMQQNVLIRERRAEDTTQFLTKQLNESKRKLDEQDSKLADFQRRYMGELPDQMQTNFSLLTGLASQLEATSQALNRAQQDKMFVQNMLDQQPLARTAVSAPADPNILQKQLESLQNRLAALQAQYTDAHPDVRRLKKDIAQLQRKIEEESPSHSSEPAAVEKDAVVAETPRVQQLRAQLYQINRTIQEKTAEQSRVQQEISKLQGKLQLTPAIAQEYKALTRDYQTAVSVYNDLLKKQSDSEMATDLERRQQGEQFRVLDPPSLPQRPTYPNRPVFAFGGFVGGLAFGLAVVFALEAQDTTFRTERDVERMLKLPALAMIPLLEMPKGSNNNLKATVPQRSETAISGTVS
ncbi:MAG TPA: XrtA system polysaccharide chain length determinant [Candidatus Acidoferrum sp.]|nr:XrtA system polysaccharide chain length determinant [Candidatus Acidoferrum sp.]